MFEDSLVESSGRLAARHPWTTVVSFTFQALGLGLLLLFSLLYTESLPTQRWIDILQAPPPPPSSAPAPVNAAARRVEALQAPIRWWSHGRFQDRSQAYMTTRRTISRRE